MFFYTYIPQIIQHVKENLPQQCDGKEDLRFYFHFKNPFFIYNTLFYFEDSSILRQSGATKSGSSFNITAFVTFNHG